MRSKTLLILFVTAAITATGLFIACHSGPGKESPLLYARMDSLEAIGLHPPAPHLFFPSGRYAGFGHSLYCNAWDTLIILKDHRQANIYHLERHTWYQRLIGTDYFATEYAQTHWDATWDSDAGFLKSLGAGPDITVNTATYTLTAGDYKFSKVE